MNIIILGAKSCNMILLYEECWVHNGYGTHACLLKMTCTHKWLDIAAAWYKLASEVALTRHYCLPMHMHCFLNTWPIAIGIHMILLSWWRSSSAAPVGITRHLHDTSTVRLCTSAQECLHDLVELMGSIRGLTFWYMRNNELMMYSLAWVELTGICWQAMHAVQECKWAG